ncbi:MAG: DUF1778 domain-containing protein [Gammaproteobacteria bacterium]|nr:DUF1778 domain-containing protein [Gammaproteobacteria bacterium]
MGQLGGHERSAMERTSDKIMDLAESSVILEQAGLPWKVSETVRLTRRESLRLMEALENPPPMNEKLKKLMADYFARAAHFPDGTTVIRDLE